MGSQINVCHLPSPSAAPWVLVKSLAFNARYSAFRNMTFRFDGKYFDALRVLFVWRTEGASAARKVGHQLAGPTATPLHRALLVALGDSHWEGDREVEALVHSGLGTEVRADGTCHGLAELDPAAVRRASGVRGRQGTDQMGVQRNGFEALGGGAWGV